VNIFECIGVETTLDTQCGGLLVSVQNLGASRLAWVHAASTSARFSMFLCLFALAYLFATAHAMDVAGTQYFTFRNDSIEAVQACHLDESSGLIFIELHFLHFHLQRNGGLSLTTRPYDWAKRWRASLIRSGVPPGEVHMAHKRIPGKLDKHVGEVNAFVSLLISNILSRQVSANGAKFCMRQLVNIAGVGVGFALFSRICTGCMFRC
jgi:hypothetical protein